MTLHQRAVAFLTTELSLWCRAHGGEVFPAPLDVKFSERTALEPDVLLLDGFAVAADDLLGPPEGDEIPD